MELYLSGLEVPPLRSLKDSMLRAGLLRKNQRELRTIILQLMSQGMVKDPNYVMKVFREHSEDLLYNGSVRAEEEKSLIDQYEEIKNQRPHIQMGVDKKTGQRVARVTGL